MSVIVTDAGFAADTSGLAFAACPVDAAGDPAGAAIDIPSHTAPETLPALLGAAAIRIDFPSFADGRGFTLARLLRLSGFAGRLRARGHVIADQYAMARRSGFDEVEIDEALARRQPEAQWLARADWQSRDYQARMRAPA